MTKEARPVAIDIAIVDFAAAQGSSEIAASGLAHELHLRALRDIGPSPETCTWNWYAHDGGDGNDRTALAADLTNLHYPDALINDLLVLWDAASRPIVGVHQQSVAAPARPN